MNVFVLGNISELRPGKSDVKVVIQNRSGQDVKLKPYTEIGTVIAANIVLTQASSDFDLDEQERVPCMLAQVESTDLPGETHLGSSDPKNIIQKLNLS